MADIEEVKLVEVPVTTLMKIVKHCRENGNDETMGIIMGTVSAGTCFVGNWFPHHSKRSTVRPSASDTKVKKSIVDKAVEYFESTNYDNNVCGIYINIPSGKFYSSSFINTILTSSDHDLLTDAKICIAYERSLAELGMNPFTAFKLNKELIASAKGKKVDQLMKNKIAIDELDMKVFRSSYDQAFLAEYVCPKVPEYASMISEDISLTEICCNFLKLLETEVDNHIYMVKSNEHELKKQARANKKGKGEESADINRVDFLQSIQTMEQLNQRIMDAVDINLSQLDAN